MIKETKKAIVNKTVLKDSQHFSILSAEIIAGSFLIISLIYFFLKIRDEILDKELAIFDMQILHFFYINRNPLLDNIMVTITNFGSNIMIGIWGLLVIILAVKKYYREAALLGFVLSMAAIINAILKMQFQRARPQFHPLVIENDYSFPSGHAMDSMVFYMMLVYLTYRLTKNKKLTIIAASIASLLILLIGISRIYLGVHYPSDVLAGYIAGLCWLLIVFLIHKTLVYFRLFRTKKTNSIG